MKVLKVSPMTGFYQIIAGVTIIIGLATSPSFGAESMSPDAERILLSMSSYISSVKALSVKADVDFEVVTLKGEKLQFSSLVKAVIERPAKFHLTRKGVIADYAIFFDSKIFTIYSKNLNAYSQTEVSGTIDDAFLAYEFETGLPISGADLFFTDAFTRLSSDVESGVYIGTAYVGGAECHHLAFRNAKTDWQLWVKVGDQPLPMKYVITTKWLTGAPQYQIRLRDWDINPKIEVGKFTFSTPNGAKKIETFSIDTLGGLTSTKEEK